MAQKQTFRKVLFFNEAISVARTTLLSAL